MDSRADHCGSIERLLLEFGASNSNLEDRAIVDTPGFYERAARVTVDAFEAFYGKQERRVERLDLPWNISDNAAAWHCSATGIWVVNRKFIDFYQKHGEDALTLFGLPIESELAADDGSGKTTQYFERARFELHPENAGTRYEVQLGRLGAEAIAQRTRTMTRATPEIRLGAAATGGGQRLEIVTGATSGQRTVELNVRRIVITLDDDDQQVTVLDGRHDARQLALERP